MYCSNCGNSIDENTKFCPNCGKKLIEETENNQPVIVEKKEQISGVPTLVMGILSVAFPSMVWFLSFLGIVFGIIGKKKAKMFQETNGSLFGMAKVGNILSKVGFILGIVVTALVIIYVTVLFFIFVLGFASEIERQHIGNMINM